MGDLTALTYVTECNAVVGVVAPSPQNPELEHESPNVRIFLSSTSMAVNNDEHEVQSQYRFYLETASRLRPRV